MLLKRLALAGLAAGVGLATAGCTEGYGYTGLDIGYGTSDYGYYGSGYADPYYGGYGYPSSYGWYNDFYYPGTGVYVYDQYRRPYRWNNNQQRYWQNRRGVYRGDRDGARDNWNGFNRERQDGHGGYRNWRNRPEGSYHYPEGYPRASNGRAVVPNTFQNPQGDAGGSGYRGPDAGANGNHGGWRNGGGRHGRR